MAYVKKIQIVYCSFCSCMLVCRTWNMLISQNKSLMKIIDVYRKKCASRKRKKKPLLLTPNPLPRLHPRPALSLLENQKPRHSDFKPSLVTLSLPPNMKVRPCPNCTSPAKELNLRRAECTKCSFDFCRKCFMTYHLGKCKTMEDMRGENWEDGSSSIHIAGRLRCTAVKKRLKRL